LLAVLNIALYRRLQLYLKVILKTAIKYGLLGFGSSDASARGKGAPPPWPPHLRWAFFSLFSFLQGGSAPLTPAPAVGLFLLLYLPYKGALPPWPPHLRWAALYRRLKF